MAIIFRQVENSTEQDRFDPSTIDSLTTITLEGGRRINISSRYPNLVPDYTSEIFYDHRYASFNEYSLDNGATWIDFSTTAPTGTDPINIDALNAFIALPEFQSLISGWIDHRNPDFISTTPSWENPATIYLNSDIHINSVEPLGPHPGNLWFNPTNGHLHVWTE